MPTPPYAKLRVALNGGGPQTGGIVANNEDSVQLSLESTVGVTKARWEIYEYPEGFAVPAGWTQDPTTHVYYAEAITPPAFTLPEAPLWGKFLLRVRINDGDPGPSGLPAFQFVDQSTALNIIGPSGAYDVAHLEEGQFDSFRKWAGSFKRSLRRMFGGDPNDPEQTATDMLPTGWSGMLSNGQSGTVDIPLLTRRHVAITAKAFVCDASEDAVYSATLIVLAHRKSTGNAIILTQQPTLLVSAAGWDFTAAVQGAAVRFTLANTSGVAQAGQILVGTASARKPAHP